MKTFLLILAIILVLMGAWAKHKYKTEHFKGTLVLGSTYFDPTQHKVSWFFGSLLSFASEAVCWWYIITQLFVK